MVHATPNHFKGLEHLATAIILLNAENRVVYINPGAEITFAFSATHVTGMLINEVFPNCEISIPLRMDGILTIEVNVLLMVLYK